MVKDLFSALAHPAIRSRPDEADLPDHVQRRMRRRQIPENAVYDVVGDADEVIERDDGRYEYTRAWERRTILAIVEGEGEERTMVTVMELERRRWRR